MTGVFGLCDSAEWRKEAGGILEWGSDRTAASGLREEEAAMTIELL
jgi:hypothetical protein